MPLYEYECDACGHRFETIQRFSDPPLDRCPKCGGAVRKLQSAPAFHLKGTCWYITDYARKDADAKAGDTGGEKPGEKSAEKSGEKPGETSAEKSGEKATASSGESKADGRSAGKTEGKGEAKAAPAPSKSSSTPPTAGAKPPDAKSS